MCVFLAFFMILVVPDLKKMMKKISGKTYTVAAVRGKTDERQQM